MRILLVLVFTVCTVSILNAQSKPSTKPAAKPAVTGRVGYVDVDQVVAQLPEYKELEAKLQEMRKRFSDDLVTKQQNFDRLYTDYMQNGKSMADSSRVKVETQLQHLDAELAQFNQNAQNTFENTRKLFLGPVYLRLGGVIREVAIENGYSMILPYTVGQGELLLHSDPSLNVSDLVLKKFASN